MFISPSTEGFSRASELEGHTAARAPGRAPVTSPELHTASPIQLHGDAAEVLNRVIQSRLDQGVILGAQL